MLEAGRITFVDTPLETGHAEAVTEGFNNYFIPAHDTASYL